MTKQAFSLEPILREVSKDEKFDRHSSVLVSVLWDTWRRWWQPRQMRYFLVNHAGGTNNLAAGTIEVEVEHQSPSGPIRLELEVACRVSCPEDQAVKAVNALLPEEYGFPTERFVTLLQQWISSALERGVLPDLESGSYSTNSLPEMISRRARDETGLDIHPSIRLKPKVIIPSLRIGPLELAIRFHDSEESVKATVGPMLIRLHHDSSVAIQAYAWPNLPAPVEHEIVSRVGVITQERFSLASVKVLEKPDWSRIQRVAEDIRHKVNHMLMRYGREVVEGPEVNFATTLEARLLHRRQTQTLLNELAHLDHQLSVSPRMDAMELLQLASKKERITKLIGRIGKRLERPAPDAQRDPESPASSLDVPTHIQLDHVHLTFTGPASTPPGGIFYLQFWAHFKNQSEEILRAAQANLQIHEPPPTVVTSEGPFCLERGARLSVELRIHGLRVSSNHKSVLWAGEIGNTNFVVSVPKLAKEGPRKGVASIRVNGSQIATMEFIVFVGTASRAAGKIAAEMTPHATAFASYASEDRDAVISRIQGMQKVVPHLQVFVDVVNMRSGQNWEDELWRVIQNSDVLYLFWCRHAKVSEWVEKEWRFALGKKGLAFIDPIPLEDPQYAPPPRELAGKHFSDPLIYFSGESSKIHGKQD